MTTELVALEIVADAGPLIHLDEVGCLDLLSDFSRVTVPGQVWSEVENHRPKALLSVARSWHRVSVEIPCDKIFQALIRSFSLDLGEQAAIFLMKTRPNAVFLTDDASARLAASSLNYRTHGTLGTCLTG